MAGLLVPLSSALISRIAGPEEVKIALKEEACLHNINIQKVLRGAHIDGVQELEILLESPSPLTEKVMRALKLRAEEETGKKIKLKIRTLLVDEM